MATGKGFIPFLVYRVDYHSYTVGHNYVTTWLNVRRLSIERDD